MPAVGRKKKSTPRMGEKGRKVGQYLGDAFGGRVGGAIGKKFGKEKEGRQLGDKYGGKAGGYLGNLLPFKDGGKVKKTGPILAHKGEFVLPRGVKPTPEQSKKVKAKGGRM